MTPLATFGVCILTTLALILIPFFIVGNGFALYSKHGFAGFKFKQGIQLFITIAYNITFPYFFLQLHAAIKI
jgi:hypothetical protein